MRGIPRALGCIAYLSVWREVGALCVERLAVLFPIYSFHSVDVFKTAFLLVRIPFWSSYGFVLGETQLWANFRSSLDSRHVGVL